MLSNLIVQQAKLSLTTLCFPHYSNRLTDNQGLFYGARSVSTTKATTKTTKKAIDDGGIPKRPAAARSRFFSDFFAKEKFSNNIERLKAGHEAWKALSDAEKKRYESAHAKEMTNFEKDMKAWQDKMTAEGHEDLLPEKARAKLAADLGKPKRPLSPFMRYHSSLKLTGKSIVDHSRAAGEAWNKMSDAEKQSYTSGYSAEMEKYKKEMSEWRTKMATTGHVNILPLSARKTELKKTKEHQKK
uniref:HMG box domain-containing protein n=1 Tax=Plectus sambesii TaxID=2011161 RepID=A0A914V4W5_9BILA